MRKSPVVQTLSVLTLLLSAITMGLALAHALEFPGKLRLDERTYRAVQTIYYPGFTIGGLVGEAGALVLLPVLLFLMPFGTSQFWWSAVAFGFLALGHATYWLVTHPTNSAWLQDADLSRIGGAFFSVGAGGDADWRHLRNVWEYSHIARAGLGGAAVVAMAVSLTK